MIVNIFIKRLIVQKSNFSFQSSLDLLFSLRCFAFTYPPSVHVCSGTSISAELDEVEVEDGTKILPVSVIFPEGNNIPGQYQDQVPKNDVGPYN